MGKTRSGVPNGWNGHRARKMFAELFCDDRSRFPEWLESVEWGGPDRPAETHFVAHLDIGPVPLCVKPTEIGIEEYRQKHPGQGVGFYMSPYRTRRDQRVTFFFVLRKERERRLAETRPP